MPTADPAQLTFEAIAVLRREVPTGLFVALTHPEQLFVLHLLADPKLSQTAAAIGAGYSKRRARQAGSEIAHRPHVKAAIDAAIEARCARIAVTADNVVDELRRIAFADPRRAMEWDGEGVRFIPSDEIDTDTAHSIAEVTSRRRTTTDEDGRETVTVEMRMKHHSKEGALALLARHTKVTDGDAGRPDADEQARAIREQLDAMDEATAAA